jgi:hypothetical protein
MIFQKKEMEETDKANSHQSTAAGASKNNIFFAAG